MVVKVTGNYSAIEDTEIESNLMNLSMKLSMNGRMMNRIYRLSMAVV
jgi:hypothetical protein